MWQKMGDTRPGVWSLSADYGRKELLHRTNQARIYDQGREIKLDVKMSALIKHNRSGVEEKGARVCESILCDGN
jgi:hypothetical protein